MNSQKWNKQELVAYILIYIANIDLKQSDEERDYLLSRIDQNTYQSIYDEFNEDNDFQSIEKITEAVKTSEYFDNIEEVFAEIKLMAFADGDFHQMEQSVYNNLKRLLNS